MSRSPLHFMMVGLCLVFQVLFTALPPGATVCLGCKSGSCSRSILGPSPTRAPAGAHARHKSSPCCKPRSVHAVPATDATVGPCTDCCRLISSPSGAQRIEPRPSVDDSARPVVLPAQAPQLHAPALPPVLAVRHACRDGSRVHRQSGLNTTRLLI